MSAYGVQHSFADNASVIHDVGFCKVFIDTMQWLGDTNIKQSSIRMCCIDFAYGNCWHALQVLGNAWNTFIKTGVAIDISIIHCAFEVSLGDTRVHSLGGSVIT